MKGHIRKRSKNSWTLQWYEGMRPDGRKKWGTCTVRGGPRKAEAELHRILSEIHTGQYVDPAKITVGQYLEKWLSATKDSVSAKTHERYAEIVRKHLIPALGRCDLGKLKPLHIQSYYSEALQNGRLDGTGGLSPQSVVHFHHVLSKALKDAVNWEMLPKNPCDSVRSPRVPHNEKRALTPEEIRKLFQGIQGSQYRLPILIALATGLRRGEVLALRWNDVDFDNQKIYVRQSLEQTRSGVSFKEPKSARGRRPVDLPEFMLDELRRHREEQDRVKEVLEDGYQDQGLVFCQPEGRPITPNALTSAFYTIRQRIGVVASLHDLRHTYGTILAFSGVHAKAIQELMGHSTITTTMDDYVHPLPTRQREAAQMVHDFLAPLILNPETECQRNVKSGKQGGEGQPSRG